MYHTKDGVAHIFKVNINGYRNWKGIYRFEFLIAATRSGGLSSHCRFDFTFLFYTCLFGFRFL
jgi:hypothetical protein